MNEQKAILDPLAKSVDGLGASIRASAKQISDSLDYARDMKKEGMIQGGLLVGFILLVVFFFTRRTTA